MVGRLAIACFLVVVAMLLSPKWEQSGEKDVLSIAYTSNGRLQARGDAEGRIELSDGRVIHVSPEPYQTAPIWSLRFKDERTLLAGVGRHTDLHLLRGYIAEIDLTTGEVTRTFESESPCPDVH
jgi:hypothetical protein